MTDRLQSMAAALLEAATRAGADAADALVSDGRSLSIDVSGGKLEHVERAEGIELGLRVIVDGRQACVATADQRRDALAEMAARAVAMAREAPRDPHVGLAEAAQLADVAGLPALDLEDSAPGPDPAALEKDALAAEAAALAVKGVSKVDGAASGWSRSDFHLAATNGFSAGYGRSSRSVSAVAIIGEGAAMERDWAYETRIYASDLPAPDTVGRLAGERAVARAGPKRPPTGAFPVVFDERVAASLIGHLLGAVNGAAIARGQSWLRDALGARILPANMSVIEDPHRPRTPGSRPFDVEGLPTVRREIVRDGVLTGWTLDLGTGRKLGQPSTASAARAAAGPPSPSHSNIELTAGTGDAAGLMGEMGRGLYVTSLIGSTINPNTGDYSRGAGGFWVEGGEIIHPVNECTIAGNLRSMLRSLVAADDARAHMSHRVPSLLVEGLTLASG